MEPLESSKEIRGLAMSLTYHLIAKEDQTKAIHMYVAQQVRYEQLYEIRRPHRTAQETLAAKAGCCAEKSYLAIVLARCAGLDARYVSILLRPEKIRSGEEDEQEGDDEDSEDENPTGLEAKLSQQPRGHAGVNIHLKDKIIFLETTDPKGYDRRPADDELLSFKEITDDQVIADFNARNAPVIEQVVEPYTPKDVVVQASNELMVGIAKRVMMVCIGAGLTLMYSCATQAPRTSPEPATTSEYSQDFQR